MDEVSLRVMHGAPRAGTRAGWRAVVGSMVSAAVLALACGGAAAQAGKAAAAPAVLEVQPGDTFSAIAARFTGDVRSWRRLYDPKLTGLANPNRISVGMRFEFVDDAGRQYLRRIGSAAPHAAVAAAPAPAPAPAPRATAPAAASAPLVVAGGAAAAPVDNTLVIGLIPNIASQTLQAQYDHLKRYLERVGTYKVRIVLPSNFKAFYDAMMRGEYDLAVTAPHFGRVAQVDRGLQPVVMYEPRINALLISPIQGGIAAARDIKDKPVAFANPTSLVAMYGQQWLAAQHFEPSRDYEVKSARTDMGVGRMLLTGEAVAAIMSNGEFRALPADESARLKIVEVFARIPNFLVMANPKLDRDRVGRLRAQLKSFLAEPDEGAAFGKATGFTAVIDVDDGVLRELDPYVPLTRRVMGPVN